MDPGLYTPPVTPEEGLAWLLAHILTWPDMVMNTLSASCPCSYDLLSTHKSSTGDKWRSSGLEIGRPGLQGPASTAATKNGAAPPTAEFAQGFLPFIEGARERLALQWGGRRSWME